MSRYKTNFITAPSKSLDKPHCSVRENDEVFWLAACLNHHIQQAPLVPGYQTTGALTAELSVKAVEYTPPEASVVTVGSLPF